MSKKRNWLQSTLRDAKTGGYSASRLVMVLGAFGFLLISLFVVTLIGLTWIVYGPWALKHLEWLPTLMFGGAGSGAVSIGGYVANQLSNKENGFFTEQEEDVSEEQTEAIVQQQSQNFPIN